MRTVIAWLSVLTILASAATARAASIEEFPLLRADAQPAGIVLGPDGNLYFAEVTGHAIASMTPTGQVTEHGTTVIPATSDPFAITVGPDNRIWFTTTDGGVYAYDISTDVTAKMAQIPGDDPQTQGIVAHSGRLWVSSETTGSVYPVNTDGVVDPPIRFETGAGPHGLASDASAGRLWMALRGVDALAAAQQPGADLVVRRLADGITAGSAPTELTVRPDHSVWFTEASGNGLGVWRPDTDLITEFRDGLQPASLPWGITGGPDGNVWFTERQGNRIGHVTDAGTGLSELTVPTAGADPFAITSGPDGNLYFTERAGNRIGRVNLVDTPPVPEVRPSPRTSLVAVRAGQCTDLPVDLLRSGGSAGTVTVSMSGLGEVTSASVSTTDDVATLTLCAPASSPLFNAVRTATITATPGSPAAGTAPRTATIHFVVGRPFMSVPVAQSTTVDIVQGDCADLPLSLRREEGASGAVDLTFTAPGVSAGHVTTAADSADMVLCADADTAAETRQGTVTATPLIQDAGAAPASTQISVHVTTPAVQADVTQMSQGGTAERATQTTYDLIASKTTVVRTRIGLGDGAAHIRSVSCQLPGMTGAPTTPATPADSPLPILRRGSSALYDCWFPAEAIRATKVSSVVRVMVVLASGVRVTLDAFHPYTIQPAPQVRLLLLPWVTPVNDPLHTSITAATLPGYVDRMNDAMRNIDRVWPVATGVGDLASPSSASAGIRYTIAPPWTCAEPVAVNHDASHPDPHPEVRDTCDAEARALGDSDVSQWNASHPGATIDKAIALSLIPSGSHSGGGQSCRGTSSTAGASLDLGDDLNHATHAMANLLGQELAHCFGEVSPASPNYCKSQCDYANSGHSIDWDFGGPADPPFFNTVTRQVVSQPHSMMYGTFGKDDDSVFLQAWDYNHLRGTLQQLGHTVSTTTRRRRYPRPAARYGVTGTISVHGHVKVNLAGNGAVDDMPSRAGGYALLLSDRRGRTLASQPFSASFTTTHGHAPTVVPFEVSAAKASGAATRATIIKLNAAIRASGVHRLKGRTLATIALPRRKPTLALPRLTRQKGQVVVRWRTTGPKTTARLLLVRDKQPGIAIADGLTHTSLALDQDSLGAGKVRITVIVSDGLHLVQRTSRSLTLPSTVARVPTLVRSRLGAFR